MSQLENEIADAARRSVRGSSSVDGRFRETRLRTTTGSNARIHSGSPLKSAIAGAWMMFSVVWIGVLWSAQSGFAQSPATNFDLDTACADVPHHGEFVTESKTLVDSGVERDRVLEILSCVAAHPNAESGVAKLAIRALLYLAEDDSQSRDLLIEIVNSQPAGVRAVKYACRVLVYIADEGTRRELLEFAKRQWPSNKAHHAMEALKDLGDDDLVTWIDQLKKELPADGPHHFMLDRFRAYVKIQESVPRMLAYMESDGKDIDRDWLVRQAMRRGATRGQVRSAAIALMHRVRNDSSSYPRSLLVRECEKYDIFRPEDVRKYRTIWEYRENHPHKDLNRTDWLRVPEVKRAEFYRQNR